VSDGHGFRAEAMERYAEDSLWSMANRVFQYRRNVSELPLRARGLGPTVQTIGDISSIELPLERCAALG
jgi:hypothetical protein